MHGSVLNLDLLRMLLRLYSLSVRPFIDWSLLNNALTRNALSGLPTIEVYAAIIMPPIKLRPSRRPPISPSKSRDE